MWSLLRNAEVADANVQRLAVRRGDRPATFAEVVQGWQQDADFRSFFNASLAAIPYSAFRWETPAVTATMTSRPFEFVALNSPGLDRRPEPEAFAEQFRPERDVLAFPNLRGDAIMIVPRPISSVEHYGHLAAFVRGAPERQRDQLWQVVGETMAKRLGSKPVWLSTAGAGVSWLHVRLDDRPKYYGYAPFRAAGQA